MTTLTKRLTFTAALLAIGCGSDTATTFAGNPGSPPPPVALADTFSVLGNGLLSGVVTLNDTLNNGTVSAFQNPSTLGGTVSVSSTGQLTYTPPLNQSNLVDTFTYTLANSSGTSSATVTVNIGARGYFVKNNVINSGLGTQANPFKTLAEAAIASNGVNGAQIVLFRGNGTSTNQDTGLTLSANQGISSLDPTIPATITGPINITTGNTIKDLNISGTLGTAIRGTSSSGATLSGLQIDGVLGSGVSLMNCTGTFTINNSTIRNAQENGLVASSESGNLVLSVNSVTFANVTARDSYSNTTGSAAHNMTVANTNVIGGLGEFVSVDAGTTGQVRVNMTNNTCQGNGVKSRGLGILAIGPSNIVAQVSANNITNCAGQGVLIIDQGGGNIKARFTANRLLGNAGQKSLVATTTNNAANSFGAIFQNNLGEIYEFTQIGASTFAVEALDQFNAASNNTGTPVTVGTITNAPTGSLMIP